MTASYMRADKTCDKVDAQIWVVYFTFRDEFTHPFIKVRPLCGTNRELCSCPIWKKNMWVGLVQRIRTKLSKTASSSRRSRSKQQDDGRLCRRTFSIQMFTSDYLKLPHLCFDKTTDSIQEYDYYTS